MTPLEAVIFMQSNSSEVGRIVKGSSNGVGPLERPIFNKDVLHLSPFSLADALTG